MHSLNDIVRRFRSPVATLAALLLASAALAGCDNLKVKKPDSDPTPPSLVWNVFNRETNEQADHPGNPTLNVKRGDSFRIMLKASDPQGVQSIELNPSLGGGEMAWTCLDPPVGQNKTATFGPLKQDLAPDASGMVLTSIFLIQNLDFAMPCPPGFTFGGGNAKLTGRATNYFGGATTSVITFTVAP